MIQIATFRTNNLRSAARRTIFGFVSLIAPLNLCGTYSPPLAAQPARASELGVLPGEATGRRLLSLLLADRVALSGGGGVPGGG